MTDAQPAEITNLDLYGGPELPWSRARDILAAGPLGPGTTLFLGTTRPDGRPHAAGIAVVWLDGDLYFAAGPRTRKARNLEARPASTISARLAGIDLVLDGSAVRATDQEVLARAVAIYRAGGWPAEVDGNALTAPFSAPSAGPPPWHLYRFRFGSAVGVATTEPYGATRWRFDR